VKESDITFNNVCTVDLIAKNKRYRGDECVELPNESYDISVDFYTTQLSKLYFPESQRNNIAQPGIIPKGFMLGASAVHVKDRSTCPRK
jgi:hypothetical protein